MRFPMRFRGYDRHQVDEFLAQQADILDAVGAERASLKRRLLRLIVEHEALKERTAQLEAKEHELDQVLIDAQMEAARRLAEADARALEIESRAKVVADFIGHDAMTLQGQLWETRREAIELLEGVLSQLRDGANGGWRAQTFESQ